MYYFTADEHHNHSKILQYVNRPFFSVEEMNEILIENHNKIVGRDDITVHAGDFGFFKSESEAYKTINRLNGTHIFLRGSHDKWMNNRYHEIWQKRIEGIMVVVCHYAMRTWHCSHYNSWNLFGHSHGHLETCGKQHDIGVDCNDFRPISFEQLKEIMLDKPDNFNLIREING